MDNVIDFTDSKASLRVFGGSDRKFSVYNSGKYYMIKFTENHAKRSDTSSSHV